jgi:PGF-pre-PGF domain-containing protein
VNNILVNFTITTNQTFNLTSVNITIPSGATFIIASNQSSLGATVANFTNSTNSGTTYLLWSNYSVASAPNDLFNKAGHASGTTSWFAFNLTTSSAGSFVFTVQTYFNGTAFATAGLKGNSSSTTFAITNGTITLTNQTFSDFTYNGSSITMNFTGVASAPMGGGSIYDNITFNLFITNTTYPTIYSSTNYTCGAACTNGIGNLSYTNATAGVYNFSFVTNGTGNYSSASLIALLNISKAIPAMNIYLVSTTSNQTITYLDTAEIRGNATLGNATVVPSPTFDIYISNVTTSASILLSEGNPAYNSSIVLGNGTWQVVYNTSGSTNYTSASNSTLFLLVNKGTPSPSIALSPSSSVSYGTSTTATASGCPTTGATDVTCTLTRSDGLVTFIVSSPDTQILNSGTVYTYGYYAISGSNWTSASTTATLTIGGLPTPSGAPSGGAELPTGTQVVVNVGSVNMSVPKILANSTATIAVSNSDTRLTELDINTKNQVQFVGITVNKINLSPLGITAPQGSVYNQWNVALSNIADTDINQVTIKFAVEKSWITNNSINPNGITLQRFKDNAWQSLTTTKLSEDNNSIYYSAVSPGFSYFAITGSPILTTTTTTTTPTTTTTAPVLLPTGTEWTYVIIALIVIVVVFFLLLKSSKKKR